MGTSYYHLSAAERTTLMVMLAEGLPPITVARHLGRSRSTISRELGRNRSGAGDIQEPYDAIVADDRARSLLAAPSLNPKLGVDTPLFGVVQDQLREGWSPEQIAGRLARPAIFVCGPHFTAGGWPSEKPGILDFCAGASICPPASGQVCDPRRPLAQKRGGSVAAMHADAFAPKDS